MVIDTRAAAIVDFERYLHAQIPLTRAMGVTVSALSDEAVRLRAAFAPNINHQRTAFGGSIATLATTAAWAYVHTRLQRDAMPATVVIQRNSVEFVAPAYGDLEGVCESPTVAEWQRFMELLHRRGRSRIDLHAEVCSEGSLVARFTGRYVALRP